MRVTIEINCDNDAFLDRPEHEVARILTRYSLEICKNEKLEDATLRDINGNKVGTVYVESDDE